jgi:hypothetical protein
MDGNICCLILNPLTQIMIYDSIFAMFYITFYFYHNYMSRDICHHNGLLGIARIWYHSRRNQEDILKMRYNHLFEAKKNQLV